MNNITDILQAISIGLVVASFLLNTGRGLKAIDVCKECFIFLNNGVVKTETEVFKLINIFIYKTIFRAYCLIPDYTKALIHGRELLDIYHECGETNSEGNLTVILAKICEQQYKYVEAEELYEKATKIMKEMGDRKNEASTDEKIGVMSYCLGEYHKAKEYLEKALAIRIQIGDKEGEASSYRNLGTVFLSIGEYDKAKEYLEKALAIIIQIGDKEGEASSYGNLGTVFLSIGEYENAKEYLEKALAIRIQIGDKKGVAADYGNLGTVFLSLGEYDKAKEYLEKALAIRIQIGDKRGVAADYGNLGSVFESLGEYDKAKEYLEKALAIRIQIADKRGVAADYGNLGSVFGSLGEYDKAKEYIEKALAIRIQIGDKRGVAAQYGNLGSVFESLGEYDKAKEYLEKALAIKIQIGDKEGEASSYVNLGTVFLSLGEYDKAKEYLEKALAIKIQIGDKEGEASSYGNLGAVFESLGEYDKAKQYLEKALAISIQIGDKEREARSYGNLGTVFLSLGEYDKAKEYLEKALAIKIQIGDKNGVAADYGNLGAVFLSLGEYDKAKEYLEKALAIKIQIGDKKGVAADYGNLGAVFQSLRKYEEAKEYHEKALAIRIDIGDRAGEASSYVELGTVLQCLGQYDKPKEYYEKALAIRIEIGSRAGKAHCYGKLGSLLHSFGEHVMAENYLEKAMSISQDIGELGQQLDCLCLLTSVKLLQDKFQEAFDCLLLSVKKSENLRGHLRENEQFKISFSDVFSFPYQNLAALFVSLGNPNNALYVLELARARALADLMASQYALDWQISADPQSWIGIDKIMNKEGHCSCLYISYYGQDLFLWILKANGVIYFRKIAVDEKIVGVGLVEVLDDFFAKSFRSLGVLPWVNCEDRTLNDNEPKLYSPEEEKLATRGDDDFELSLSLFYNMIIAPVADLLEGPEIIVIPERYMYRVPFSALLDGSGKYLSETFRIRIVPSLTILKFIQDSSSDHHSQSGVLLVGDPEVGKVRYNGRRTTFSPLPFARKEAEMIGQLLGVQPLLGKHATKQAVLEMLHSVGLIHFAAHGSAERGEIALSPVCSTSRCPKEEEYLLRMSDISKVQLRAKLVVLSCCHSGRGQIRGEGVIGIARAFLGSGARSVLVALWAIDDKATEAFMSRFYKHLVRGESASESLHEATKWMRDNDCSKVKQWAPFMLIGDNVSFEFGK